MTKRSVLVRDIQRYMQTTEYETQFWGDLDIVIGGFCALEDPVDQSITWVKNPTEESLSGFCKMYSCVVVTREKIPIETERVCYIITPTPRIVFFCILNEFFDNEGGGRTGIASSAIVETENIGENVSIGHNCYVGKEVIIGEGTVLEHNVSICNKVIIGKKCIIHAGAVIGTDGFGHYIKPDGRPQKIKHFGGVYIGDEVEIGANACIDRGTLGNTHISSFVKIDNLVHIAHNVRIDETAIIVAGAVICGSARLQQGSYVAPGGIVKNQLLVGENAFVGMGAVVTESVEKNKIVAGVPARIIREVKADDK